MVQGDYVIYRGSALDVEDRPEYVGVEGMVVRGGRVWVLVQMPDGEFFDGLASEFTPSPKAV